MAAVAGGGSGGGRGGIMKEEDGSSDDGPDRFGDHVSSSCASGLEDTQKKTVKSHISLNRDRARNFNLSEGGQLRKKNIHMLLKMLGVHFRST